MKRTTRLLSLVAAALLLIAGCTTAEEAGQTATEGGGETVVSEAPSPEPIESESQLVTEPALEETSEPTTDSGGSSSQSLVDVAAENPQLSQLVTALQAGGLTDALEQAGPLTVFAPNNEAFAQLDQADLTALLSNPQELRSILQYHVVEGEYLSSDLSDGQTLTTLSGDDLTVNIDGGDVTVDGAQVVRPDIEAGNGVIHIINGVIRP